MGKRSLCVLLLALGLVVQFLKFLLQAEILLAEMQYFLVVLSLHVDDLVLIGFDDLFEFFNDSPMVSLLALPFHLFIIILVLLHIGPQLIDLIIQVLKLLACLYLDNLQQFFLLVYLFGMLLEFFFFLLDALLQLDVLIAETLHNVFVAAEFLEGFLHAQHYLGSQSLGLQVQLLHFLLLLEVLLVELDVAGHFFDALLLCNRQDLLWIEMTMQLLELGR